MPSNDILVAIWMVTYNHQLFIEQAVNSVMAQQTDFRFKLFIGEDFSTDNTRNICFELKNRFSDKIELITSDLNVGAISNALRTYKACFGSGASYIAMLEGDDYWTDCNKLQKQVSFLEANSEFVLCGHLVNVHTGQTIMKDQFTPGAYTIDHVIGGGRICHTVSLVFRNQLTINDLNFMKRLNSNLSFYSGDQAILLLLMTRGAGYVINEYMAVYRKHDGGVMNVKAFHEGHNLSMYFLLKFFNEYTKSAYKIQINARRLYWLELIIRKELIIKNKILAGFETFTIRASTGIKFLTVLPYFIVKALFYKLLFRKR